MDKCLRVLLLVLIPILGFAQSLEKVPRFLIGVETNINFQDVQSGASDFRYAGIGLQIEKPVGQFSFGTAFIRQNFSGHYFYQPTGLIEPPERPGFKTRYGYDLNVEQIRLISIPVRVQYRLPPCNCAYIQGAVLTNFMINKPLRSAENVLLIDEPTDNIFSMSDVAPFSMGYELAIGFNMHASDVVKIIGRLAYIHYGLVDDDQEQQFRTLGNAYFSFNLGLQYAFYKKDKTEQAL